MSHPYRDIPDAQRWSRAMAGRASNEVDPVWPAPFRIEPESRIVTAGSCFAQHVARHLGERGRPCFVTESAHPLLPPSVAAAFNYGVYSARYGNIYTPRQLLQLWRRSTGAFVPRDDRWDQDGACFDPFRPTIQPGGFSSPREYAEDRRRHFAAVCRAFGEMDVFVFTLGLTECWASREDGAVYPLCPGVAAGRFEADRHGFLNLTVEEVVADMTSFVTEVRAVNPRMKMILTVSPVPLAATAERQHVLAASVHSKAVLRVAADRLARLPGVCYFPAYEIIGAAGNDYFATDRRSVTEAGVSRVMALFFQHVLGDSDGSPMVAAGDEFMQRSQVVIDAWCDEQRLDPVGRSYQATEPRDERH